MPAGGLFSTVTDCGRFMQMVLNKGTYEGKRYLSPEAVEMMTSKQTDDAVADLYGFGWATGENHFSHGGAGATNMAANTKLGMITVYLIQGFRGNGGMGRETFIKDAEKLFE